MELHKILTERRKQLGLSVDDLAARSNVPKGTLAKLISGNTKSPEFETVRMIAHALDMSLDDLDNDIDSFSMEEKDMVRSYRRLDKYGKKAVRAILDVELSRMENMQAEAEKQAEISIVAEEQEPMITLPYFLESAAAGVPLWTDGEYENLDFPASFVPDGTDFAVGVKGRSMEPDYPEGCTVFVHQTEQINDGDVVIAWLQGEGTVIKCALVAGDKIIRLESINREYPDIVGHKLDGVKIFGKVLGYME